MTVILLVVVLAVAAAGLGLAYSAHCERRSKFYEKYPPISDQEFVRRCGPDVNAERAIKVRHLIAHQLGVPAERIHPETRFDEID